MKYIALVGVEVGWLGNEPPVEVLEEMLKLHLMKRQLETIGFSDVKVLTVVKVDKL